MCEICGAMKPRDWSAEQGDTLRGWINPVTVMCHAGSYAAQLKRVQLIPVQL